MRMKRGIILFLVTLFMASLLSGCGKNKSNSQLELESEAYSKITELESENASLKSQVAQLKSDAELNPTAELLAKQVEDLKQENSNLKSELESAKSLSSQNNTNSEDFLQIVFWEDGNFYQITNSINVYTDCYCSNEASITNITVTSPTIFKFNLSNGNTVYSCMSYELGIIYFTQKPSLKEGGSFSLNNPYLTNSELNQQFMDIVFWHDGNNYTYNNTRCKLYSNNYCLSNTFITDDVTLVSSIIAPIEQSNQITVYAVMSKDGLCWSITKPTLSKK